MKHIVLHDIQGFQGGAGGLVVKGLDCEPKAPKFAAVFLNPPQKGTSRRVSPFGW